MPYMYLQGIINFIILPHYYFPAFYLILTLSLVIVFLTKNSLVKYKFYSLLLITLLLNFAMLSLVIHFAPVSKDVGACGSGFSRYVVEFNINNLTEEFLQYNGKGNEATITRISSLDEIAGSINYQRRYLKLSVKYKLGEKEYLVHFTGKRYWIELFNWQVNKLNEEK